MPDLVGVPLADIAQRWAVHFRDANRLAAQYGGNAADWAKVRTSSFPPSDGEPFEIHAYANEVTGQIVEEKTKFAWGWDSVSANTFRLEWRMGRTP